MSIKRSDVYHIPATSLKIEDGFNVRVDYGDIENLADSIIENGVKVPLRVYKERGSETYIIVDGHRRFKAIEFAGDKLPPDFLIPCIMETKGSNEEDRVLGMIIYNDGKRLNIMEEAEVYKRLVSYGWDSIRIAKKVSKSRTHIDNCLLLLTASPELKQMVINGEVSPSFVIEEIRSSSSSDEVVDNIKEAKKVTGAKKISKKHVDKVKEVKKEKHVGGRERTATKSALSFLLAKGLLLKGKTKFLIVFDDEDERVGKDFDLVDLLDEYKGWK